MVAVVGGGCNWWWLLLVVAVIGGGCSRWWHGAGYYLIFHLMYNDFVGFPTRRENNCGLHAAQ